MLLINVYQQAELTVIMIYITLCAVVLKMFSITMVCEKEEKKQNGRKI